MLPSDSLKAGQPACDADIWLRIIAHAKHVNPDGTLHLNAFKKKGNFTACINDPHKQELSGVLASKTTRHAIAQAGNERAAKGRQRFIDQGQKPPSDLRFVGVVYQTAEAIRGQAPASDVIYTPINDVNEPNEAHADIVTTAQPGPELESVKSSPIGVQPGLSETTSTV